MGAAFTLAIQGPFAPKTTTVNDFVAVRVAGTDNDTCAEVFVTTRAEADAFIAAFTEARDQLPEEEPS